MHVILLLIYSVNSLSFTPIWWRKLQLERQIQHEQIESKLHLSRSKSKKHKLATPVSLLQSGDQTIHLFDSGEIQARSLSFDTVPILGQPKMNKNNREHKNKHQFDIDFDDVVQKIDHGLFDPSKYKNSKQLPPLYPMPNEAGQLDKDDELLASEPPGLLKLENSSNSSKFTLISTNSTDINLKPHLKSSSSSHLPLRARFLNQISKLQENRVILARERSHMLEIERARRAFVGEIDNFFAPSRQVRRLKENLKERINDFFTGLKTNSNITSELDVAEFDKEKLRFRNCKNENFCPWVDGVDLWGFLKGYGCHCIFDGGIHHSGPIQDELDGLCKQMSSCLRCVEIDLKQLDGGNWCEEESSKSPVDAVAKYLKICLPIYL